jgi:hypothetical protein
MLWGSDFRFKQIRGINPEIPSLHMWDLSNPMTVCHTVLPFFWCAIETIKKYPSHVSIYTSTSRIRHGNANWDLATQDIEIMKNSRKITAYSWDSSIKDDCRNKTWDLTNDSTENTCVFNQHATNIRLIKVNKCNLLSGQVAKLDPRMAWFSDTTDIQLPNVEAHCHPLPFFSGFSKQVWVTRLRNT